jgi:hypothetical protein
MQQPIFQRILELLSNAGLLTGVTEEQIREARADNSLISALARLLYSEERACLRPVVFYDAECLYEPSDLIRLINKFAAATEGDWTPQSLQADWDGLQAQVAFEFQGQPVRWTFPQQSDGVACAFYECLGEFTQQHLLGVFVNLPTRDQCACHLYLPRDIAAEVAFLAALDAEAELDSQWWVNVVAEARRLGWLADVPFARQVGCGGGSLQEMWLPDHSTSCLHWLDESQMASRRDGSYYEEVIRDLAQLTSGEWAPQQVRCTSDEDRPEINIAFDFRHEHFTWHLEPPAERLAATFSAYLTQFAAEVLDGGFVELRLNHNERVYLYLPRATAKALYRISPDG